MARRKAYWLAWSVLSMAAALYLGVALLTPGAAAPAWLRPAKLFFVPGATSHGHYQIETACETCHRTPFAGRATLQEACVDCHGAELKEANDTHPLAKFTDPRNAERTARLDATQCVTCHVEHRPEVTHTGGVTLPLDYCFVCHQDIAKDRPSHAGLAFNTCATSGCHKFHDNRALYEDYLLRHAEQPRLLLTPVVRERALRQAIEQMPDYPHERFPRRALDAAAQDGGAHASPEVVREWLETSHAQAGVNCSGCHQPQSQAWVERPDHRACATCHDAEAKGFLAGRHGMPLAQGLEPMSPALARLPMRADAHGKALGCASCHSAHRFDPRQAAVQACQGCHDDAHTKAYAGSPHHDLWLKELAGELPAGAGVSCASCHMPRVRALSAYGEARTLVQHNQNDTLRPAEKMIRPVCQSCHGLAFAIDALADPALAARSFRGAPSVHIRSIDMARARAGKSERPPQPSKGEQ
jgi:hypothetical protein